MPLLNGTTLLDLFSHSRQLGVCPSIMVSLNSFSVFQIRVIPDPRSTLVQLTQQYHLVTVPVHIPGIPFKVIFIFDTFKLNSMILQSDCGGSLLTPQFLIFPVSSSIHSLLLATKVGTHPTLQIARLYPRINAKRFFPLELVLGDSYPFGCWPAWLKW